jgi:Xaa-Pro aminopeptidase
MELTKQELENRQRRLISAMNEAYPDWDTALILGKVNLYYFTGTIQDALLLLRKDGSFTHYVKRSYERALEESPLAGIRPMNSYREAAMQEAPLGNTYIEGDLVPFSVLERLKKSFDLHLSGTLDRIVMQVRSVKSAYELFYLEEAGRKHDQLLSELLPELLREGMSEAELVGEVANRLFRLGYHGFTRFSRFQSEMMIGQFGFGVNSLIPTNFDGPGGSRGYGAAVPAAGDPNRFLKKGDLVFVDIGFGINGYNSDKTQVYSFGAKPSKEAESAHRLCIDVEKKAADLLKPGALPSEIYTEIMAGLDDAQKVHFMGYKDRRVKFLGHGIGLHVDEIPVIAQGFDRPLEENMVIALEPKKGVEGEGMVGVEDTYIVTPRGGRCITGGPREIIVV